MFVFVQKHKFAWVRYLRQEIKKEKHAWSGFLRRQTIKTTKLFLVYAETHFKASKPLREKDYN